MRAGGRMGLTTIKAPCPTCGEVDLVPSEVTLRVCENLARLSEYRFTCPLCGLLVVKPLSDLYILRLRSAGVRMEKWRVPDEALEPHDGPPITYDDILDFHNALFPPFEA